MNQIRKNKMETNTHGKTKIEKYWIKRFKQMIKFKITNKTKHISKMLFARHKYKSSTGKEERIFFFTCHSTL